jgi:hypothetical protein
MSTRINETEMTSTVTDHTAQHIGTGWVVTWLPGRMLTANQAVTAMTIAETVAAHGTPELRSSRWWGHVESWAEELGLNGPYAASQAVRTPESFRADKRLI